MFTFVRASNPTCLDGVIKQLQEWTLLEKVFYRTLGIMSAGVTVTPAA
jgi:hypothetical protein